MTEELKRRFDLIDLKVSLDTPAKVVRESADWYPGAEPRVVCELEATRERKTQRLNQWSFPASQFGLPATTGATDASASSLFRLPDRFGDQFRAQLQAESLMGEGPLWLHLARPYGYLDLVPWERLLQPFAGMPILRLPDFLVEPPRETPSTLDVILWASMPVAKEMFSLTAYLGTIIRLIPKVVPRTVTFHVFTDAQFQDSLRQQWEADKLIGQGVELYRPEEAGELPVPARSTSGPDPTATLENPWFLWMHKALKGRSVDCVHFIGHGYFAPDWPALAVAESPRQNVDVSMARFIGPAQLNTFLTQVGAWAVACSSPPHNYSELGLRHLLDTLAQLRPGSVLFHDLANDLAAADLTAAYRFLFSFPPQVPPASPNLFLYCQPYQVNQAKTRAVKSGWDDKRMAATRDFALTMANPPSPTLEAFQTTTNVPAWLAATQRYVEEWVWKLMQWEREQEEAPDDSGRRRQQIEGVRLGLTQIQNLVAKVLQQEKGGVS